MPVPLCRICWEDWSVYARTHSGPSHIKLGMTVARALMLGRPGLTEKGRGAEKEERPEEQGWGWVGGF